MIITTIQMRARMQKEGSESVLNRKRAEEIRRNKKAKRHRILKSQSE